MSGLLEPHLAEIRRALRSREQLARRRFGQHFLLQAPVLKRIAALGGDLQGAPVFEVGPGPGSLTAALLEAGAHVTAWEIDRDWAGFLADTLAPKGSLEVLCQDVMADGCATLARAVTERSSSTVQLIANLPYQISAPLVARVLMLPPGITRLAVTVQKEVADRLVAAPGDRARGRLGVVAQLLADVRRVFVLPPGAFTPPPRVRSAVVVLEPRADAVRRWHENPWLDALVRRAFQSRRKMLRVSLSAWLSSGMVDGLDEELLRRRPQELDLAAWQDLAAKLAEPGAAPPP